MANRNLLQEAIADAKTIKATAIENATLALEETFTPYLKEKLSAKLAEMENEETMEEDLTNELDLNEEEIEENDDLDLDELLNDLNEETKEESEEESEEETEEEIDLENMTEDDLKSFVEDVIKDMVSSGDLQGNEESEEEEAEEELDEVELEEYGDEHHISTKDAFNDEDEEELDLDELLAELKSTKQTTTESKESKMLKNQLNESLETIKELKSTLNEVNIFNAKLLYSNKIFKSKDLNESQKIKVLTAFDKAKTKKEAELVYNTLLENMNKSKVQISEVRKPIENASRIVENIKPKSQIIPTNDIFARMNELAGIN